MSRSRFETEKILTDVQSVCEDVLRGIFKAPRMFGNPQMVEGTFLDHLRILLVSRGVDIDRDAEGNSFHLRWVKFVNSKLPKTPSVLGLADRFKWETEADWEPFLKVMREYLDDHSDAIYFKIGE